MLISPISNVQFAYQNSNKAKYNNNNITNSSNNSSVANSQVAFMGPKSGRSIKILQGTVATMEEAISALKDNEISNGKYAKFIDGKIRLIAPHDECTIVMDNVAEFAIKNQRSPFTTDITGMPIKERRGFTPYYIKNLVNSYPNLEKVTIIQNTTISELTLPTDSVIRKNLYEIFNKSNCLNEENPDIPDLCLNLAEKMVQDANIEGLSIKTKLLV